jgi:hypothetical protein
MILPGIRPSMYSCVPIIVVIFYKHYAPGLKLDVQINIYARLRRWKIFRTQAISKTFKQTLLGQIAEVTAEQRGALWVVDVGLNSQ